MGIRTGAAKFVSAAGTFALRNVFHRPAANFPGKIALYVDPRIIANTCGKLRCGSICVVGTNGKTTVTNLVADCLQAAGFRVVCNRTGANLDSGVATSLLQAKESDWGVFETDELWLAKSLPQLQSRYVLLLNLFRDQLDRVGDISRIQDSIAGALSQSPQTTLIYNADDPLCEAVARKVANPTVPIGIGEDLGLPQNTVCDARVCQQCDSMLEYAYRQYGQLGDFRCRECGFCRAPLAFAARDCRIGGDSMSFDVVQDALQAEDGTLPQLAVPASIEAGYTGAYMIYNLLAVYAASHLMGAGDDAIMSAIKAFDPRNGRLQALQVQGREVLLNLAKNPAGFNQNLSLVVQAQGRKAAAFFVNDMEGDGRDVSWIWDVDFEELASQEDLVVFVGGIRKNDLQVRLKYAGVNALLVEDADDLMARMAQLPADYRLFAIANYTALPPVHARMSALAADPAAVPAVPEDPRKAEELARSLSAKVAPRQGFDASVLGERPLRIAYVLSDLLNLYGDSGNVRALSRRCEWRGIPCETAMCGFEDGEGLGRADIVVILGGSDREQAIAFRKLSDHRDELARYIGDGGALLAVGDGFRMLGASWLSCGETVPGLGVLDVSTDPAAERANGDVSAESPIAKHPVAAFRNQTGATVCGDGAQPFCRVAQAAGAVEDGILVQGVLGTCLHGPVLPKNPELADWLIGRALQRRTGFPVKLSDLDDSAELAANAFIQGRLGSK